MRRSSRILCFLAATALAPSIADARGFGARGGLGFHGRPGFGGGARFGGLPRVIRPGMRPGFGGRLGRFGRGYGRFGFGYGLGFGLGDYGLGGVPNLPLGGALPPAEGGGGDRPPVFIPVEVPPPPCPMIIAVDGGLRHAARTRIVYGSQPACRR